MLDIILGVGNSFSFGFFRCISVGGGEFVIECGREDVVKGFYGRGGFRRKDWKLSVREDGFSGGRC